MGNDNRVDEFITNPKKALFVLAGPHDLFSLPIVFLTRLLWIG